MTTLALTFKAPTIHLDKVKTLRLTQSPRTKAAPIAEATQQLRTRARDVILLLFYWMLYHDSERIHADRRRQLERGEEVTRTPAKRFDLPPRKKSFTAMFVPIHTRQPLTIPPCVHTRPPMRLQLSGSRDVERIANSARVWTRPFDPSNLWLLLV